MRGWIVVLGLPLAACAAQPADLDHLNFDAEESIRNFALDDILESFEDDGTYLTSPLLDTYDGVTRISVMAELLASSEELHVEARGVRKDGSTTDWVLLPISWSDETLRMGWVDLPEKTETGQVRLYKVEHERVRAFSVTARVPVTSEEVSKSSLEIASRTDGLDSRLSDLNIVPRSQWGARRGTCRGSDSRRYRMSIHHTATPSGAGASGASRVRGYQRYHMNSRGWCDIGYHFVIDRDGTIYEGRPLNQRGAHVGGHNTGNIGISFIGCYGTSCRSSFGPRSPSNTMIQSASRLVARLSSMFDITRDSNRVRGHNQWSGVNKDCPGANVLSRMTEIYSGVDSGEPTSAQSCNHSLGGRYAYLGCSGSYQCCNGRWARRGACGDCTCVETTGRNGCGMDTPTPAPDPEPPTPPEPPPADPTPDGASCTHSLGGSYSDLACSGSYQCCDGRWRTQRNGCGECACTETTGRTGCSAMSSNPEPPPQPQEPEPQEPEPQEPEPQEPEPQEPEPQDPEPEPAPPDGASCTHSLGGSYANTACSASYQCCNGRWRTQRNGCGECFCTEGSGRQGCGL